MQIANPKCHFDCTVGHACLRLWLFFPAFGWTKKKSQVPSSHARLLTFYIRCLARDDVQMNMLEVV